MNMVFYIKFCKRSPLSICGRGGITKWKKGQFVGHKSTSLINFSFEMLFFKVLWTLITVTLIYFLMYEDECEVKIQIKGNNKCLMCISVVPSFLLPEVWGNLIQVICSFICSFIQQVTIKLFKYVYWVPVMCKGLCRPLRIQK